MIEQRDVLHLLKNLQRERGLALLLVTHDWDVVAKMCERVATFYVGQFVEIANVGAMFDTPRNPYTIALREADPHIQTAGSELQVIDGQVPSPGRWPIGCHFQDRCARVPDAYRAGHAPLVTVAQGHQSRCVLHTNQGAQNV